MTRLAAEDFVAAGWAVLEDGGDDALTVASVCDRLGVTKGSFYHHFEGLPGFVAAMVADWETAQIEQLATRPPAADRIGALVEHLAARPHTVEAGLRARARREPEVALAVERVDRRRERAVADVLAAAGLDRAAARRRARLAVTALVGAQAREQARRLRELLTDSL